MNKINFIDGTNEQQTAVLKEFFGLSPNQSFQELEDDDDSDDDSND